MLNLAVGLGVIDQTLIHPDLPGVAEVQELVTYELSAIVSNNVIGDSEPMDDVMDEFGLLLRLEVGDGSDFDPLGEFVNGDQEVVEAPRRLLELPDHVEAPDREWLGDGNSLERLGQQVTLLGVVLAPFA